MRYAPSGLIAKAGASGSPRRGTNGSGKRHDDFADVLAAGHEPEGRIDAARREGAKRQRTQRALLDQRRRVPPSIVAGQRFVAVEDGIHRDDVERGVAPQRPERDARVLVDVAFADLDEAAELREAGKAHRDGFAGERVEDHVHAAAVGEFHHRLREIAAARIDDVLHAERFAAARVWPGCRRWR